MIKLFVASLRKHLAFHRKFSSQKFKAGERKSLSTTVYLQVLGNGSQGSGPSIYLFSNKTRYLFNCGEGTQRLANENRTNLSKIEHIFLTRSTWNRFGGIPGMCLTLQDFDCRKVNIHAPPGVDKMFDAARKFLKLADMEVKMPKCLEDKPFEDSVMSVQYVPLQRKTEETEEPNYTSMAFVCKLHAQPGDFSLEKCIDLGIESSELGVKLKNGQDITMPDGSIVKAVDVLTPSLSSAVFIFIDIPDETFLERLITSSVLNDHGSNAEDVAKIVVHFTSDRLTSHPLYRKWQSQFPISTTHWFVNDRNTFSGQSAQHLMQHQLNLIDDNVFPLLGEVHPTTENTNKELRTLNVFHLRPSRGFENYLPKQPFQGNFPTADSMTAELVEMIRKYKCQTVSRTKDERAKEFPKVVTLGTGSGMPSKTRNDSANLIQIDENNYALLDCGEGTLSQLVRFYGKEKVDDVLRKLRFIFVSHLHADHHLGLIQILNYRRKLTDEKAFLIAPAQISPWLTFYNYSIEEIFSTFDFFACADLLSWEIEEDVKRNICNRLGLSDIETCYVCHCRNAFGISLAMKNSMPRKDFPNDNVKITYSGDAAPSPELINIGRNSCILIHEATMEDGLEEEARYKKHSTMSQAIEAGRKMNAKFVILTHFSNRYAKIPLLQKNVENICIAFDNMQVSLLDLRSMHLIYDPLISMFSKQIDQLERKATQRKDKEERENRKIKSKLLRFNEP